jgi:hypothetical protein
MAGKTTLPKGVSRKGKKQKHRPGQQRDAGRKGGKATTPAKQRAVRENGKLGGAPTKYRPEYVDQIKAFFDKAPTEMLHKTIETKKGDIITVEEKVGIDFPTLEGFAQSIKVSQRTIHEWMKVHPDFKEAVEFAKTCQAAILLANGMHGHYMQPLTLLFAKNNMGYREKIALTDEDGGSVKQEVTLKDELSKRRARVLDKITKMAASS